MNTVTTPFNELDESGAVPRLSGAGQAQRRFANLSSRTRHLLYSR